MKTIQPTKIKYLTNKDLMEEIHNSKKSYCEYIDNIYSNYDIIVNNLGEVNQELLDETRKQKVIKETIRKRKELISKGNKNPVVNITIEDFPQESIVIRLMTFDHIPINQEKINKAKTESEKHLKCNFPPFQHFIIKDNEFYCVGKSHWQGGIQNGWFSTDHGKMSSRLALMFMKLVERYGHRGNWRNYCVTENCKALTKRGWLSINEINENDIILSYKDGELIWSKIYYIYRGYYNGHMWNLKSEDLNTLVTPYHKMVTLRGLVKIEDFEKDDILVIMGNSNNIDIGQYFYKTLPVSQIKINKIDNYNGMVWCPKTEYGCFVAIENEKIHLTGNTYLDEMKNQSLLQLSQVGLQFDESRSNNPFSYYTQILSNAFCRVLNIEKKNQNIRDDLLSMHGASPSYTRMNDSEIANKKLINDIIATKTGDTTE
jgi:hypothetical protein